MNEKTTPILAAVRAENFIGRQIDLEAILRHAAGKSDAREMLLLSAPKLGASELLRQIYDQLFNGQAETIPFYFAARAADENAADAARRFLLNFVRQTVAFRRRDAGIVTAAPNLRELAELAAPEDGHWIDRLTEMAAAAETGLADERAFVRNCLSAPLRATAAGAKIFVMIDDLHETFDWTGEIDFFAELQSVFAHSAMPFVLAGRRRFLYGASGVENYSTRELLPLDLSSAGLLAENLAARYDIKINDQTRDLIAVQFGGNPFFITSIFQAANEKQINLDSFHHLEKIYADDLFGGRAGKFYDGEFAKIDATIEVQKNLLGLLYDALTVAGEPAAIENWQRRGGLEEMNFRRVAARLNFDEIIRVSSARVELMSENEILTDYIAARFRLEIIGERRALVVGEMLGDFLKRAPLTMANFYRRASALDLRGLLAVFDLQEIPAALLDYAGFKNELKGASDAEISQYLDAETSPKIKLPQIAFAAHTVAFYPQIEQVAERERSAVALGFADGEYNEQDEIVWIAAEIDSKLEATRELTEFWCDRLEMVALVCNFKNYRIWLVAPEGFAPDALESLGNRGGIGSSRRQIERLIKYLGAEEIIGEKIKPNEFEIIVPMGADTEMIAAQTVEEIAKRHHFSTKAVNQIKTALVEACINAAEHSHSPDRKIYQKFAVEADKIVITIANRGLRLTDKNAREFVPDEGRRGWGLKLMKTLMDEVKFEQVDDGTRIKLVKYLANS